MNFACLYEANGPLILLTSLYFGSNFFDSFHISHGCFLRIGQYGVPKNAEFHADYKYEKKLKKVAQ